MRFLIVTIGVFAALMTLGYFLNVLIESAKNNKHILLNPPWWLSLIESLEIVLTASISMAILLAGFILIIASLGIGIAYVFNQEAPHWLTTLFAYSGSIIGLVVIIILVAILSAAIFGNRDSSRHDYDNLTFGDGSS